MATAWDKLEQLLTCAICLDRFRSPKMLPCQHSFCQEPCMEGLQDYARRQIKCPECRAEHRIPFQGIQSYPTNVTLQRFLELHQSITGEESEPVPSMMERCGVCSEKSTVTRCSHCDKKVCPECKEAHIDIMKREISRICHQVRRALNRLQDALSQTERSMERLNVNSVHIRDEIEEIVRRFVKDLKAQEGKMLKDLETYSQVESKNLVKLKEDLAIEYDFLKDNCDLVEKKIVDAEKSWNDVELTEVKYIFVKTLDFLRNFDADAADYTRGMKFLPSSELESLRRNLANFGELKLLTSEEANANTRASSPGLMNNVGSSLSVPQQSMLMRSQSDHRLATQFARRDSRINDLVTSQSRLNLGYSDSEKDPRDSNRAASPSSYLRSRRDETSRLRRYGGSTVDDSRPRFLRDSTDSYRGGWARPDEDSFSSGSQFKSRFMRERGSELSGFDELDYDPNAYLSRSVRFEEPSTTTSSISAPLVKVFDTPAAPRGCLSGIVKLSDTAHYMERSHENQVRAKVEKEKKEEETRNLPPPSIPSYQTAQRPRPPSRQVSEDEIDKQKKMNQASAASSVTTSVNSSLSNSTTATFNSNSNNSSTVGLASFITPSTNYGSLTTPSSDTVRPIARRVGSLRDDEESNRTLSNRALLDTVSSISSSRRTDSNELTSSLGDDNEDSNISRLGRRHLSTEDSKDSVSSGRSSNVQSTPVSSPPITTTASSRSVRAPLAKNLPIAEEEEDKDRDITRKRGPKSSLVNNITPSSLGSSTIEEQANNRNRNDDEFTSSGAVVKSSDGDEEEDEEEEEVEEEEIVEDEEDGEEPEVEEEEADEEDVEEEDASDEEEDYDDDDNDNFENCSGACNQPKPNPPKQSSYFNESQKRTYNDNNFASSPRNYPIPSSKLEQSTQPDQSLSLGKTISSDRQKFQAQQRAATLSPSLSVSRQSEYHNVSDSLQSDQTDTGRENGIPCSVADLLNRSAQVRRDSLEIRHRFFEADRSNNKTLLPSISEKGGLKEFNANRVGVNTRASQTQSTETSQQKIGPYVEPSRYQERDRLVGRGLESTVPPRTLSHRINELDRNRSTNPTTIDQHEPSTCSRSVNFARPSVNMSFDNNNSSTTSSLAASNHPKLTSSDLSNYNSNLVTGRTFSTTNGVNPSVATYASNTAASTNAALSSSGSSNYDLFNSRLSRSKSSHLLGVYSSGHDGSDDDDDTSTPSVPTYRSRYAETNYGKEGRYQYRTRQQPKDREKSPPRDDNSGTNGKTGTTAWSQYLRNKYGSSRNSSASSTGSGSRAAGLSKSKSSHAVYSRNLSDSSDDDTTNISGSIVGPKGALSRKGSLDTTEISASDSRRPSYGYNLPRSTYLQKRRMMFKIGTRGTEPGCFTWPRGIACGPDNTIVVADSSNHRVQVFDSTGRFLNEFGSYGSAEGEFDCLAGVSVNRIGQYIVSDRYNHRVQIFDPSGRFLRSFGCEGRINGRFSYPWGITTDSLGFIYVCDKENHRIQVFQSDGTFVGKFGSIGNSPGLLEHPHYIAVSNTNRVVVSDSNNHRIQIFDVNGRSLSTFGCEGTEEGQFKFPRGIAVDDQGYIIVGDSGNNRIQIFNPDGTFLKAFGSWGSSEGEFKGIEGIAVSTTGNILVCDRENHRIQVF